MAKVVSKNGGREKSRLSKVYKYGNQSLPTFQDLLDKVVEDTPDAVRKDVADLVKVKRDVEFLRMYVPMVSAAGYQNPYSRTMILIDVVKLYKMDASYVKEYVDYVKSHDMDQPYAYFEIVEQTKPTVTVEQMSEFILYRALLRDRVGRITSSSYREIAANVVRNDLDDKYVIFAIRNFLDRKYGKDVVKSPSCADLIGLHGSIDSTRNAVETSLLQYNFEICRLAYIIARDRIKQLFATALLKINQLLDIKREEERAEFTIQRVIKSSVETFEVYGSEDVRPSIRERKKDLGRIDRDKDIATYWVEILVEYFKVRSKVPFTQYLQKYGETREKFTRNLQLVKLYYPEVYSAWQQEKDTVSIPTFMKESAEVERVAQRIRDKGVGIDFIECWSDTEFKYDVDQFLRYQYIWGSSRNKAVFTEYYCNNKYSLHPLIFEVIEGEEYTYEGYALTQQDKEWIFQQIEECGYPKCRGSYYSLARMVCRKGGKHE